MLAERMNHLGTETAFEVLARANALEAEGREIINLGIGQPDFQTPKHIVDAAKKALDDGHHGYVLSNGILECRQAVTRKIKKLYNQDIDPERKIIKPNAIILRPHPYEADSYYENLKELGIEISNQGHKKLKNFL